MSLLMQPVLTTPLLKVPLLLSHALCTYYGSKLPRPPEDVGTEKAQVPVPDWVTKTSYIQLPASLAVKIMMCGVAVIEAAVILAEHFPSSLSSHILSTFLPFSSTHRPSFRLTGVSLAGCLLGTASGSLRVWCQRTLGRFYTWQVTVLDGHELVTDGPYAFVRHPSYLGFAASTTGSLMLLFSPGSYFAEAGWLGTFMGRAVAVASAVYACGVTAGLLRRMGEEDRVMKAEFGEKWEKWAEKTPYRLIPYVY